ncbi:DUF2946 family protein [Polynucleobacter sp. UK-Kesae-W10]|uniref:DUF2946 family protein n=1 Tax=Polynucleobacter sp. UK-Kesae-W10 TaxID=1819738 RepID=UPI001C0B71AE|nr:DUF2946 family protein [Polynucleobacter sp. UK-Kesae-W10]MBU3578110.1 DUF2946 family protein [Polynucleobacter sp. UK-Kesae-W10]
MDEQVLRSLVKWPNVPDCFGWLALDRRGQWRMRDEFTQQNHLPGQVITHQALKEFISRNYACDTLGRYFFQNGPQRVYVTLDATPWIARLIPDGEVIQILNQCHDAIEPTAALSDEKGNIYIVGSAPQTSHRLSDNHAFTRRDHQSVALLHDHDLDQFAELAQLREEACSFGGSWNWQGKQLPLDPIHTDELSKRFTYIQNPQANPL